MKSVKQAQMVGQMFVYVLSIILVAVILGYGYTAVKNFTKNTEQAAFLSLKKDLTSTIDGLLSQYGSVEIKELSLESYDEICFADSYVAYDAANLPPAINPYIKGELKDKTGNNVFLLKGNSVERSLAVDKISLSRSSPTSNWPVECLQPRNGNVNVRLEGKGDHVLITW